MPGIGDHAHDAENIAVPTLVKAGVQLGVYTVLSGARILKLPVYTVDGVDGSSSSVNVALKVTVFAVSIWVEFGVAYTDVMAGAAVGGGGKSLLIIDRIFAFMS